MDFLVLSGLSEALSVSARRISASSRYSAAEIIKSTAVIGPRQDHLNLTDFSCVEKKAHALQVHDAGWEQGRGTFVPTYPAATRRIGLRPH